MKTNIIVKMLALLVLLASFTFAENYQTVAEKMPVMKGGMKSLYSDIEYPTMAKEAGVQGKVYLLMYINEDGSVDRVDVVKGIGAGCDEQAAEAAKKQAFTPAEHKGAKVKIKMAIAVAFKLQ